MSDVSKDKLETTTPSTVSAIRRRSKTGTSESVVSTLRGSQSEKLSMSDPETLPDGWARIKHPDSGVYYVNKKKGLATSSDVSQPKVYSLIMEGADALQGSEAFRSVLAHQNQKVDLVLDVQYVKGVPQTFYYCVSHHERRVFWLEGIGHQEVYISCTSGKCAKSKGATAHCVQAQYWEHCELFPTIFEVTKEVTGELRDILLQAAADRLLVKFSTSPYDRDELAYMLNLVKEISADIQPENGHSAWIIARFMTLYNDGVLHSSYGQPEDDSGIDDKGPTSVGPYRHHIILKILGPFMVFSPHVYAAELHSFHEGFTLARWSKFVHKVDQSIRDSNLLATVLLSTDVGLLAWSQNGNAVPGINSPSAEQIATYVSIICSVGSIITGLAIFKQYRATGADTPLRAVRALKRILKQPFGLPSLAIVCSLPYVLLMWSLIAFLVAFGIIFYRGTGIQVRIPVSVALFLGVLGLVFCWYTARIPGKEDQRPERQPVEDNGSVFPA